jgi:hypothetical protein
MGTRAPIIDEKLKDWATSVQSNYIDAVNKRRGIRPAARHLKVSESTIRAALKAVRKKAAVQGYSPEHDMTKIVPDPFRLRGTSTYYDKEGKPRGQWVKTQLDEAKRLELITEAFEAMAAELPRLAPIAAPLPEDYDSNLCSVYTMTDCHVGMLAWHKETGADWDIKIAERTLTACFEHMVAGAPNARTGFVNQLGDFLHSDGMLPVTPTSGHVLDQDGRFSKIVSAAIRILRRLIDIALMKHERVIVLLGEGNHDMASSIWLRAMFKALYEHEPRVQVIDSELPYYAWQHGKTMLAFHHGHLSRNDSLPLLFASVFPGMWGTTHKRYAHTGHRHHVEEKEHAGMIVVQHPTLAARDAYAARGGWISERQATAITYHDEYGQVARNTVTPEMVTGLAAHL